MRDKKTKSVFGPVPSRRLGVSLGIDLLPFKTCSMDCVYCECGATTVLTNTRCEYFPTKNVIAEIDAVFAGGRKIDYLTFAGVGEPTLHSGIGEIIGHVKEKYPSVKVCLLTNASCLGEPILQKELEKLDLIIPSLDASNEDEFTVINRPEKSVTLKSVLDAIISFRAVNKCTMWLEIFVVPSVNDSPESMLRFRDLAKKIMPEKVQLNSLDRPGVENWVKVPTTESLEKFAEIIGEAVNVEIISKARMTRNDAEKTLIPISEYNENILETLRSRPCTADDVAVALNCNLEKTVAHLRRLEKAGILLSEDGPRGKFYRSAD